MLREGANAAAEGPAAPETALHSLQAVRLPILNLPVTDQRYSCHGCGNCCRDFTVQLRAADFAKLQEQAWEQRLNQPVTIEFRGRTYLRQRPDGACIFLMDNGLCRIHAEFGFENKPIACQLFPFHLTPEHHGRIAAGINFACQSVLENKGAALPSHGPELKRMAAAIDELAAPAGPPMLTDKLRASVRETESLIQHLDHWLKRIELPLMLRLDGVAWVTSQLAAANLAAVRDERFSDLLDVLFGALPDELSYHPVEPPTARQRRMLRRAVFTRVEDPKFSAIQGGVFSRWRAVAGQLGRNRRFARGKGPSPRIGESWPVDVPMERLDAVAAGASLLDEAAIGDLMTRWLRATILGSRAWGAGYYAWPMVPGLQAMLLNTLCVSWLARLHAVGNGRNALNIADVRAALGRVDRAIGRAPWLGTAAERLRLNWLHVDDGLRRLLIAYPLIHDAKTSDT